MGQIIDLTTTQAQWGTGVLQGVTASASGDLVLSDTTSGAAPVLWFANDLAHVELGATLNFNTPTLTFECRLCTFPLFGINRAIVCWGAWTVPVSAYIRATDQVSLVGKPSKRVEVPWGVPDYTEVHVAIVWSTITANVKLYVDGVLKGTSTSIDTGGINLPVGDTLRLGGWDDMFGDSATGAAFLGTMRDIRFWTTARSQAEIQANMGTYLTGTETGLAAYYPCNVFSDGLLVDVTGNGHHGVLKGTHYALPLAAVPSSSYTESFETTTFDWYTPPGEGGWLRRSGATPTSSTGPGAAQAGSYYLYVETSPDYGNTAGDTNVLQYDAPVGQTIYGVNFYRNRYGVDQGTLYLEGLTDGIWSTLGFWTGNEGSSWKAACFLGQYESLRFVNVAAGGACGDAALDNICVILGAQSPVPYYYRVSPSIPLNLSGMGTKTSKIEWTATTHDEFLRVEYCYSLDGGARWSLWFLKKNGDPLEELVNKDLSNAAIRIRQTLLSTTAGVTPEFHDLTLTVDTYTQTDFLLMNLHAESQNAPWSMSRPHRLAGRTLQDGQPVRRRVEVRYRRTHNYVVSTCTQDNGLFEFTRLSEQALANPYVVLCYDDSSEGPVNAQVFDRVYQVDDDGLPPQT